MTPPAAKTPEDLRRIVGDGPGRAHLDRWLADREAVDAAREQAGRDADAAPRYPWQSDADRAALRAYAEAQAAARAAFDLTPQMRALRAAAEHGRALQAGRHKGGKARVGARRRQRAGVAAKVAKLQREKHLSRRAAARAYLATRREWHTQTADEQRCAVDALIQRLKRDARAKNRGQ